ncbi:MAG: LVIVD repeat-containing protein [Actinomycetota bacterium]
MRRLAALLALPLLMTALPAATAGPTAGGVASDNVEYVGFVPFEVGSSTGATIVGKYMYLTSWKNISIYDISQPEAPALLDIEPIGFRFENEDVATNGKILIFSAELPQDVLYVYDVEDKTNITLLAELPGAGGHTTTCILKCKWAYSSEGYITDLRNPAKPVKQEQDWKKLTGIQVGVHDLDEYKNGFAVASTYSGPVPAIDVRNPLKPKVIASAEHPENTPIIHSTAWPRGGKDRWLLVQAEQNAQTRCNDNDGGFQTFDTKGYKKTHTFHLADTFKLGNGTYTDGKPPANGLGCSAHWFEAHPTFKNGGLVAIGYYEHGTRIVDVSSAGKIKEVGYFMPYGGSTSMAEWMTKDLIYAIDYTRGIDILRYNGKT